MPRKGTEGRRGGVAGLPRSQPVIEGPRGLGTPDADGPKGGVLLEVLADERLRIEWFDAQEEPADFTGAAEVYER